MGLIPALGRSPREGNGNLLQHSCLGNFMDRGAWWTISPLDRKESDMTQWLNHHHIKQFTYWTLIFCQVFPDHTETISKGTDLWPDSFQSSPSWIFQQWTYGSPLLCCDLLFSEVSLFFFVSGILCGNRWGKGNQTCFYSLITCVFHLYLCIYSLSD